MKKLVYLFIMILGLSFTGCEPMEDIHEEVDAFLEAKPIEGVAEFTLTEEDYEEMELNGEFSSEEEANALLPEFLAEEYPVWGDKSIALVGVNIKNNGIVAADELPAHEVTSEEYTELGFRYGNFDSKSNFTTFLEWKYPEAVSGDNVELTYKYYSGYTSTRTTRFVLVEDTWMEAISLESEDYTAMGESFPNFSNMDTAVDKISTFLKMEYPYANAGDQIAVMYDFYSGSTNTRVSGFTYDGSTWTSVGSTLETTLQFGHNGTIWEPDNTIVYALKATDFEAIADAFDGVEGYEDPAWSAGNYSNFDRRKGNSNYWSDDMLLEAINVVLDAIDPNAEEGQKYLVSFAIYDGSAGTEQMNVIKQDGVWVLN